MSAMKVNGIGLFWKTRRESLQINTKYYENNAEEQLTLHFIYQSTIPYTILGAVALPGFVARRGKAGNYVMGHSRRTSGPGAAVAR